MSPAKARKPRLALVGSDSLKGKEILSVLAAKKFPLASLELFDPDVEEEYSKLSQFRDEAKVVHALTPDALAGLDLVFLAADAKTNLRYGRLASEKEYTAIDLGRGLQCRRSCPGRRGRRQRRDDPEGQAAARGQCPSGHDHPRAPPLDPPGRIRRRQGRRRRPRARFGLRRGGDPGARPAELRAPRKLGPVQEGLPRTSRVQSAGQGRKTGEERLLCPREPGRRRGPAGPRSRASRRSPCPSSSRPSSTPIRS